MKIIVINPNSSQSMTRSIGDTARLCNDSGHHVHIACNLDAPASIEGYSDGVAAAWALLSVVKKHEAMGADGYVIACFDDTGVDAIRELVAGPVIGIGEAAMHAASIVSSRYSIITSLERSVPIIEDNARRYGLVRKCRGVHAFNLPVLSFEKDGPEIDYRSIKETAKKIIARDRSDTLVLGCGGMTHLQAPLSNDLGVTVIEGVGIAVKFIESLVTLGLRTSKAGAYGIPCAKK